MQLLNYNSERQRYDKALTCLKEKLPESLFLDLIDPIETSLGILGKLAGVIQGERPPDKAISAAYRGMQQAIGNICLKLDERGFQVPHPIYNAFESLSKGRDFLSPAELKKLFKLGMTIAQGLAKVINNLEGKYQNSARQKFNEAVRQALTLGPLESKVASPKPKQELTTELMHKYLIKLVGLFNPEQTKTGITARMIALETHGSITSADSQQVGTFLRNESVSPRGLVRQKRLGEQISYVPTDRLEKAVQEGTLAEFIF